MLDLGSNNIRNVNPSVEQLQMGAFPQKIRNIVNIIIVTVHE